MTRIMAAYPVERGGRWHVIVRDEFGHLGRRTKTSYRTEKQAQREAEQLLNRDLCVCGHERDAHEHYRPGTECSLCPPGDCRKFRSVALQT